MIRRSTTVPRRLSLSRRFIVVVAVCAWTFGTAPLAAQQPAQTPAPPPPPPPPPPRIDVTVTVIGATPLPGIGVTLDQVPAPVQTATAADLRKDGSLDVSSFLNNRLSAVHVNNVQGNPFQADVSYRGYTASPLLGTPQGLSVYMDGVRLNQPFGDVVSWDTIPRLAIASIVLVPGSNPLFGLNTLGGALSIETKDGRTAPGTSVQPILGRYFRRGIEVEHGGASSRGLDWYVGGNLLGDDGWRVDSPSRVRQLFGKVGWQHAATDVRATLALAQNSLTGNGLQETRLLDADRASVYTKPDTTDNRSTLLNVTVRHTPNSRLTLSGNVYDRNIRTDSLNGDVNENALGEALAQPTDAEQAALAAAGETGFPAAGATSANTPFPSWRCIANVLLNAAPGETCDGAINRARSRQQNAGLAGQVTMLDAATSPSNQVTAGAAYDASHVAFRQSTELGYIRPDRGIAGLSAFADGGLTGGDVEGEPFDTRVDLDGRIHTWSVYAANVHTIGRAWHLTLSGRYNRTTIDNRDRLRPGGGPDSLEGQLSFGRLNPAIGLTFVASNGLNGYASYSQASRAPTSIELGCANEARPCKLPNAMAGDPPLRQVHTDTWEGGLRSAAAGAVSWSASWFRAENQDDILFVASTQSGFGYFKNFGRTRREGVELNATLRRGRIEGGGGYTFLLATYESPETVQGTGNSSNDAAAEGRPGLEGSIDIVPGDRIPLIPVHTVKAFMDVRATTRLSVDLDLVGVSSSYARGNENNEHVPLPPYYLGPGTAPGYVVLNLGARYRLTPRVELLAQVDNLLNRKYVTAAQLGPTAFTAGGSVATQPLPPIGGEFPVPQATFFAPGPPTLIWTGVRLTM